MDGCLLLLIVIDGSMDRYCIILIREEELRFEVWRNEDAGIGYSKVVALTEHIPPPAELQVSGTLILCSHV